MEIKVLGTGCANCKKLEENARNAVEQLGIAADIQKVDDIVDIMSYGVLSTPGLVIDGQVKASGRVPSVPEIISIIRG